MEPLIAQWVLDQIPQDPPHLLGLLCVPPCPQTVSKENNVSQRSWSVPINKESYLWDIQRSWITWSVTAVLSPLLWLEVRQSLHLNQWMIVEKQTPDAEQKNNFPSVVNWLVPPHIINNDCWVIMRWISLLEFCSGAVSTCNVYSEGILQSMIAIRQIEISPASFFCCNRDSRSSRICVCVYLRGDEYLMLTQTHSSLADLCVIQVIKLILDTAERWWIRFRAFVLLSCRE